MSVDLVHRTIEPVIASPPPASPPAANDAASRIRPGTMMNSGHAAASWKPVTFVARKIALRICGPAIITIAIGSSCARLIERCPRAAP